MAEQYSYFIESTTQMSPPKALDTSYIKIEMWWSRNFLLGRPGSLGHTRCSSCLVTGSFVYFEWLTMEAEWGLKRETTVDAAAVVDSFFLEVVSHGRAEGWGWRQGATEEEDAMSSPSGGGRHWLVAGDHGGRGCCEAWPCTVRGQSDRTGFFLMTASDLNWLV